MVLAKQGASRLVDEDIKENVARLEAQVDPPAEAVTYKIRHPRRNLKYPMELIVEALMLVASIPRSTVGVEQGHGSASLMRKPHQTYGFDTLVCRAFLHLARALLRQDDTEKSADKLCAKLRTLERTRPQRHNAKAQSISEASQEVTAITQPGTELRAQLMKLAVKQANADYKKLNVAKKQGLKRPRKSACCNDKTPWQPRGSSDHC